MFQQCFTMTLCLNPQPWLKLVKPKTAIIAASPQTHDEECSAHDCRPGHSDYEKSQAHSLRNLLHFLLCITYALRSVGSLSYTLMMPINGRTILKLSSCSTVRQPTLVCRELPHPYFSSYPLKIPFGNPVNTLVEGTHCSICILSRHLIACVYATRQEHPGCAKLHI